MISPARKAFPLWNAACGKRPGAMRRIESNGAKKNSRGGLVACARLSVPPWEFASRRYDELASEFAWWRTAYLSARTSTLLLETFLVRVGGNICASCAPTVGVAHLGGCGGNRMAIPANAGTPTGFSHQTVPVAPNLSVSESVRSPCATNRVPALPVIAELPGPTSSASVGGRWPILRFAKLPAICTLCPPRGASWADRGSRYS